MKTLIADFVASKDTWRKSEARRPMWQKVEIVDKLRARQMAFRKARALRKVA